MRVRDLLPISFRAILMNRGRSLLTMLGIIIGIASVILMVATGEAAQRYLLSQLASFGSDLVFIANGRGDETRGGPPDAAVKQTLTEHDYKKLKEQSWLSVVSGVVSVSDTISANGDEKRAMVSGTTPDELVVYSLSVSEGRFLLQDDVDSDRRVVVLGQDVAKKLFGQESPVSKMVKIGRNSFRVIGVMAPAGTRFFTNMDNQVYIPYTTAFALYNKDHLNFLEAKSGNTPPREAKDRIRTLLRETHSLDNPNGILSKDDFRVASQEDVAKNADTIGSVLTILLGSIASISLAVAGIGIMNIMYVTVTERTREIGLRKAIGARKRDILGQFLSEAIMLTVIAGLIGASFGTALSWLAIFVINQFQSGWSFAVPWNGIGLSFGVSVAIGVIFGFFPARKAAQMSPIEALRHE